jgi:hypothetical protein
MPRPNGEITNGTYVAFGACATAENVGYANEQPRMPSGVGPHTTKKRSLRNKEAPNKIKATYQPTSSNPT